MPKPVGLATASIPNCCIQSAINNENVDLIGSYPADGA